MKISIITATFNSYQAVQTLAKSLRNQTDFNFEWVVADGGSSDGTIEFLNGIDDIDLKLLVGPDFGIYDALNKAINLSTCDYYVVAGSDDYFYPQAVSEFRYYAKKFPEADFVSYPVDYDGITRFPKHGLSWLRGQFSYVAMHSVGLLTKKELHVRFGLYSRRFPIAADQYFILNSVRNGAKVENAEKSVGVHGADGLSGTDHAGVITEFYRVQMAVGYNKIIQTILCCLRLIKNVKKL